MAGIFESKRWEVLPARPDVERSIAQALGLSSLAARVLAARGHGDTAEVERFITPSLQRDWRDPAEIPGLEEVADRLQRAVEQGETIAVFGDFDVDGMTSTCLLTLALRELGADVHPFIPHRFDEGYGLSKQAVDRVVEACRPSLVVTVDNGIASAEEVAAIVERGIDVAVTDHHEPGELVPRGVPVADPKLDPECASRDLAGAGVALKLVCELGARLGRPELWRSYLDVAALGTVSDMMELTAENRALVSEGVAQMRVTARAGFVALAAEARCDLASVEADGLPFSLVPRLNAAGRMGDVDMAFDLLMASDPGEALQLAGALERVNTERRDIEAQLAQEALAMADATYTGGPCVVLGGEGWHEGVKGIVASRLVNRYHVPSLLFSISDGVAHGSGRSVGSVDLFHAVESCSDLLSRFGGHAGAVGVTLDADNLDEFRLRLSAELSKLPPEAFEDKGEVACVVGLDELTIDSISGLDVLRPFGQGNKAPLMAVRGVTMKGRGLVGATADHLRFYATDGVSSVPAIMFRVPNPEKAVNYEGVVDLVFEPVVETWQGRSKAKMMVRDIIYRTADDRPGAPSLVEGLFERAPQILSRDAYAGIADKDSFFTKAVGVTQEGRQAVVASLSPGEPLQLVREPENPYDECAVAVLRESGEQVGYLRRQIAAELAPKMDAGTVYTAAVTEVTGGDEGRSYGANLEVRRLQPQEDDEAVVEPLELDSSSVEALTNELRQAMIGDHDFLPAQARSLELLAAGESVLCVMATGRGKSLIFHVHAAREAVLHNRASIFVYPLRALVNDQAFHLEEALGRMNVTVRTLTGETPQDERDDTYAGLANGTVDVVLTTPEYLTIHSKDLAASGRIGFVVVDEAHHAGASKGGNRAAYQDMPRVLQELGSPEVLAVTATASDSTAREICRLLNIERTVKDVSVRSNLQVMDEREIRDREAAVTSVVATGEKCVVYVNSRDQSVSLARMLRQRIPELGHRISFYNAGLTRAERLKVEEAFRDGRLSCIVSTSAFGEGVNLPDIRHVMLYHMPFGAVEFNQMSGRAGRDGKPAQVHVMFGRRDAAINERILASQAPSRDDLVVLYRTLMALQAQMGEDGSFSLSNADIADACHGTDRRCNLDERSVSCGISVFKELGFLTTSGYGTARRISMVPSPGRMELSQSIRYREGERSREGFKTFCDWVVGTTSEALLERIDRPIAPTFGEVVE